MSLKTLQNNHTSKSAQPWSRLKRLNTTALVWIRFQVTEFVKHYYIETRLQNVELAYNWSSKHQDHQTWAMWTVIELKYSQIARKNSIKQQLLNRPSFGARKSNKEHSSMIKYQCTTNNLRSKIQRELWTEKQHKKAYRLAWPPTESKSKQNKFQLFFARRMSAAATFPRREIVETNIGYMLSLRLGENENWVKRFSGLILCGMWGFFWGEFISLE